MDTVKGDIKSPQDGLASQPPPKCRMRSSADPLKPSFRYMGIRKVLQNLQSNPVHLICHDTLASVFFVGGRLLKVLNHRASMATARRTRPAPRALDRL